jgi:hypothetical protein
MSSAPIQFRMIVDEGNRTLQWRHRFNLDSLHPGDGIASNSWSDWESVEEWDFLAAYQADKDERRELQIRQARALFGLTPQPAEPSASQ